MNGASELIVLFINIKMMLTIIFCNYSSRVNVLLEDEIFMNLCLKLPLHSITYCGGVKS